MANDGDAPGATQDFLPLHPAHVVHVCVVFGEAEDPTTKSEATNPPDYLLLIKTKHFIVTN